MKVKYKISDIFDLQMGKTPSRDEQSFWNSNDYKWIAISDLDDCKYIENTSEYISSQAVKNTGIKIVPKNTVIMSFKLSIGKVAITKEDMYTNEAIMAFFNKGIVNLELSYLYYLLKSYKWDLLAQRAAKGKSLNKEILNNATLCFHSNIQTQKEIVAVLDKVTSLISMRKEQLEKLDILVKSKFIEIFGDPVLNPKGWEKKKLGEVCYLNKSTLNNNTDPDYSFTYIDLSLVKEGNIQFPKNKITFQSSPSRARRIIKKNDVIIATVRPNLKGFACINFDVDNIVVSTGFAVLTPIANLHAHYLHHLFYTDFLTEQINKVVKGANYPAINSDDIKKFIIPLPPLDIQNQFAEFVEQVEKNKENIKSSLNQLETLYSALMQEYFG